MIKTVVAKIVHVAFALPVIAVVAAIIYMNDMPMETKILAIGMLLGVLATFGTMEE